MKKTLLFLLFSISYTYAQQSVNASGGNGTELVEASVLQLVK